MSLQLQKVHFDSNTKNNNTVLIHDIYQLACLFALFTEKCEVFSNRLQYSKCAGTGNARECQYINGDKCWQKQSTGSSISNYCWNHNIQKAFKSVLQDCALGLVKRALDYKKYCGNVFLVPRSSFDSLFTLKLHRNEGHETNCKTIFLLQWMILLKPNLGSAVKIIQTENWVLLAWKYIFKCGNAKLNANAKCLSHSVAIYTTEGLYEIYGHGICSWHVIDGWSQQCLLRCSLRVNGRWDGTACQTIWFWNRYRTLSQCTISRLLWRLCVFRNCTPCSYWEPPPLVISCLTFPAPECFTKSDIAAITWWESRLCISLTFSGQALLSWQGQFCGVATWRGGKNTRFTFYYECGHMPGSNSES